MILPRIRCVHGAAPGAAENLDFVPNLEQTADRVERDNATAGGTSHPARFKFGKQTQFLQDAPQ